NAAFVRTLPVADHRCDAPLDRRDSGGDFEPTRGAERCGMSGALVLASSSTSRRTMLEAAGVPFTVISPSIDEDLVKSLLIDGGADPHAIAEELAQAKALSVSGHRPDAL